MHRRPRFDPNPARRSTRPRRLTRAVLVAAAITLAGTSMASGSSAEGALDEAGTTLGPATAPPGLAVSWGRNDDGAGPTDGTLGTGETTSSSTSPVPASTAGVLGAKSVSSVTAGRSHSCAIVQLRAVCWGNNGFGQLGTGTSTNQLRPVAVSTQSALYGHDVTDLDAGYNTTCAIADGAAFCWGANGGALGNGTTTDNWLPTAVSTLGPLAGKTITDISVGESGQACAVADGGAYCWGFNANGELGRGVGDFTASTVPTPVDTTGVLAGKTVTAISAGLGVTCAIADARAYCWGFNSSPSIVGDSLLGNGATDMMIPYPVAVGGPLANQEVSTISVGLNHTCATSLGAVYCWGDNELGQLGTGSTQRAPVPVAASTTGPLPANGVSTVVAGRSFSCALATTGATCWGANDLGQLGTGSTSSSTVPVAVDTTGFLAGRPLTALAAGPSHIVALASGAPLPRPPFCDVGPGAPFAEDIAWLADQGIAGGYDDGCFRPTATVSRQAMSGFLRRAAQPGTADPFCLGTVRSFTDVGTTNPFCGAIEWLAAQNVTTGYPDGTFRPGGDIARQAMAAFLFRYLNPGVPEPACSGTTRHFSDVPASNTFCGHIEWLVEEGITTGFTDGTFQPGGSVTRQAMAAFLHRALT